MTPQQLPTKAQIAAIADLEAVVEVQDTVLRSIDHIEAQLEFGDGDEAWAKTATNALALHRYVNRLLARRAAALRTSSAAVRRPAAANDPRTNKVLRERPGFDALACASLGEVDAALAEVNAIIEALELDRADEIANGAGRRDESFLAVTGGAHRRLRTERHALGLRRAALAKAQKRAMHEAAEGGKDHEFIEAARRVLDRETYLRVWAMADRLRAGAAVA